MKSIIALMLAVVAFADNQFPENKIGKRHRPKRRHSNGWQQKGDDFRQFRRDHKKLHRKLVSQNRQRIC